MYSRDKIAQTDKRNDRRRDRFNILKLKLFKHSQNIFIYKFRCIMYMQLGVYTNIDFKTFKMGFHTYFFYIKFETKNARKNFYYGGTITICSLSPRGKIAL